MANVIIKQPEQKAREDKILRDFGHDPKKVDRETRELAAHVAEKCIEALKGGGHG